MLPSAPLKVIIGTKYVHTYWTASFQVYKHTVRRAQIAWASSQSVTLWPVDFIDIDFLDDMLISDNTFSIKHLTITPI